MYIVVYDIRSLFEVTETVDHYGDPFLDDEVDDETFVEKVVLDT